MVQVSKYDADAINKSYEELLGVLSEHAMTDYVEFTDADVEKIQDDSEAFNAFKQVLHAASLGISGEEITFKCTDKICTAASIKEIKDDIAKLKPIIEEAQGSRKGSSRSM